jgi:predicted house-cleaning NTP pyrophosphatase (Maf/HAM1 superfamily)
MSSSTTLLPHLVAVKDKATVILASKSPRRVEIMGLMGLAPEKDDAAVFQVVPSGFPEDLDKSCK